MTRAEDAEFAISLHPAAYVGVIFAGGPRSLTLQQAIEVLAPVPRSNRAAVFADQSVDEITRAADWLQLGVVQLHSGSSRERIAQIRADYEGEIWPVCRVSGPPLPAGVEDLAHDADGRLVIDSFVEGKLGGTGATMPWASLVDEVARIRKAAPVLVLAGGLRPENVATAIETLDPYCVDVSSGVERAPGIKDHDRMRAFRDAVMAMDHS